MFLKLIGERIKKIFSYRRTLWSMSLRQFQAKYAGSVLGLFWVIINPLLMMLAITFVFTVVFKTSEKDFSLMILSGILPWMFFSGALSEAAGSLLAQKAILHQFSLPKEVLPLSSIVSNSLNFLISWCVAYPIFVFHNPKILPMFIWLPFIFLMTFLFTCGISLLFCSLNAVFRDIEHLLGTLLMFWFWVTPVFYPIGMVPPEFRWIINLNPMSPFILFYRDIVFQGVFPGLALFSGVISWTLISLFFGLLVSIRFEANILKRI